MRTNGILIGYALLLLIGLPLVAARTDESEVAPAEAAAFRRAIYVSIAISLIAIAAVTLGVASWQDIEPASLGWTVVAPLPALGWAVGTMVLGLLVAWAATAATRALGLSESSLARWLMPENARETRAFLLVSGIGAVCEEYVYRGFLLHTIEAVSGQPWLAAGVTALSFGMAHGYQRVAGIARATLLGAVLAVPVVLSGSLFPAVVAHFWINAAIGLGGWRLLLPDDPSTGEVGGPLEEVDATDTVDEADGEEPDETR